MRLTALLLAVVLMTEPALLAMSGCADTAEQSLRFVPDRMAHDHVPGLSLACIHNDTVEWTQVFGVARGVRLRAGRTEGEQMSNGDTKIDSG